MLRRNVNAYLAMLLITIAGSGAALLIIHVAQTKSFGYYTESGLASPAASSSGAAHKARHS